MLGRLLFKKGVFSLLAYHSPLLPLSFIVIAFLTRDLGVDRTETVSNQAGGC